MKTTLFLLLLCGCSGKVSVESPPNDRWHPEVAEINAALYKPNSPEFTQIDFKDGDFGYRMTVTIITNAGHRFAVAHVAGKVGICEVTDASLVEPNK